MMDDDDYDDDDHDDDKVDNIFLCMIQSYNHLCTCT
jgi:hypothetical protein